uniref:Proline rich 13 n=1 Tax=Cebus imitator TaxID=2715852 RepID=A0A2K5RLB2_CEBIM
WNLNAGQPGPNPHPPNIGYPGGSSLARLPPINPPFPPGASQGNPAFPLGGPPHPVPQPGYPECPPSGPYPPSYPLPNPLAPGMVGPGVIKKMKKAYKNMHQHHKHGRHCFSSSSSSSSSDSDWIQALDPSLRVAHSKSGDRSF